MPYITDHNDAELAVAQMVFDRLPMVEDTPDNQALFSRFTFEAAYRMEPCLQKGYDENDNADPTRIGDEQYYNMLEKSLLADLVAIAVLTQRSGANAASNTTGDSSGASTGTFLKKAKAGSAEVEYEQFDVSKDKSSEQIQMGTDGLLDRLHADAAHKAKLLGCSLEICSDCYQKSPDDPVAAPFIIIKDK